MSKKVAKKCSTCDSQENWVARGAIAKFQNNVEFEAWYYKAGQIERESVVLVNFTKMARLDVRYTYRKTAVCLPLLCWVWLHRVRFGEQQFLQTSR